ncbi:class I SAM-dependent methyltransferase [Limosilactobacillus sp.]|jgi:SAM-dependent methyltransferase|uniref:class I SAM-dependent methyltransferase n=1 Tax=Limosilactobacillus sp. TaxID=2773925 RepID=UPI0025BDECBE|nr:methyltransferase domain-containing protein [Limosilactobacillus sp.]MCH3921337.1 methyltransferase domain-containing protein [Limosilactobacillus sp.]MCH3928108.1 methyltransferase domain-containing protein [Limosilactobacillus sp.]
MKLRGINVITLLAVDILLVVGGLIYSLISAHYWNLLWVVLLAAWGLILTHTMTAGHLRVWQGIIDRFGFGGHDQILDLSGGRFNDLLLLAKSLTAPAKVTGTGDWRQDEKELQGRINAAKVADRVKLVDADVFNLNFADRSFDYVLVDLAFHNIGPALERGRAVQEASRVLKADGTLVIADCAYIDEYQRALGNLGFNDIRVLSTGFNGWWGGPWTTTKVLIAKRYPRRR